MHPVYTEMKKGHLGAIKFCREFAEPLGLTPARADMLRAVLIREERVRQSELWRMLGVSKVVVSIMVRALERLGFVERYPCELDRRTFWVRLLKRGRSALRRIYYETITEGYLDHALIAGFARGVPHSGWRRVVQSVREKLAAFRETFGRRGSWDIWAPDDEDKYFYYATYAENPILMDLVPDPELDDDLDENGNFILVPDQRP